VLQCAPRGFKKESGGSSGLGDIPQSAAFDASFSDGKFRICSSFSSKIPIHIYLEKINRR